MLIFNINDMKKKNLKSLKLNKSSISELNSLFINGGTGSHGTLYGTLCDVGNSLINGTKGDCVNTWGDDGCPTGWDGLCVYGN